MKNKNLKIKKVGRPSLKLDNKILNIEIKKYLNKEQSATKTYQNLKIGKTSFYKILKNMEVKR